MKFVPSPNGGVSRRQRSEVDWAESVLKVVDESKADDPITFWLQTQPLTEVETQIVAKMLLELEENTYSGLLNGATRYMVIAGAVIARTLTDDVRTDLGII